MFCEPRGVIQHPVNGTIADDLFATLFTGVIDEIFSIDQQGVIYGTYLGSASY